MAEVSEEDEDEDAWTTDDEREEAGEDEVDPVVHMPRVAIVGGQTSGTGRSSLADHFEHLLAPQPGNEFIDRIALAVYGDEDEVMPALIPTRETAEDMSGLIPGPGDFVDVVFGGSGVRTSPRTRRRRRR